MERTIQLRKLAAQFASFAEQISVIIIKELNLPEQQKTLKPVKMGGVAGKVVLWCPSQIQGGEKYISCGIFFKLARDWVGLYGGDSYACKAAEHELKGRGLKYMYNFDRNHGLFRVQSSRYSLPPDGIDKVKEFLIFQ